MPLSARKPVTSVRGRVSLSFYSSITMQDSWAKERKAEACSISPIQRRRVWVRGRPMHAPFASLVSLATLVVCAYLMIGSSLEMVCCFRVTVDYSPEQTSYPCWNTCPMSLPSCFVMRASPKEAIGVGRSQGDPSE